MRNFVIFLVSMVCGFCLGVMMENIFVLTKELNTLREEVVQKHRKLEAVITELEQNTEKEDWVNGDLTPRTWIDEDYPISGDVTTPDSENRQKFLQYNTLHKVFVE